VNPAREISLIFLLFRSGHAPLMGSKTVSFDPISFPKPTPEILKKWLFGKMLRRRRTSGDRGLYDT